MRELAALVARYALLMAGDLPADSKFRGNGGVIPPMNEVMAWVSEKTAIPSEHFRIEDLREIVKSIEEIVNK
jgi:hypothetical protein